jgi:hypothetical protein
MAIRTFQTNFTNGEISPLMEGRVDFEKYFNSVQCMENILVYPHGPATFRPGFRFINGTKINSSKSRSIPFIFSKDDALDLEFGEKYIRFYKSRVRIDYEVVSPYTAAEVDKIKYIQSGDVLYLFHPAYLPRKLMRVADNNWYLQVINFRPPPMIAAVHKFGTTLTPSAKTGNGVTFTAGAGVFLSGDIARLIKSGTGRASIAQFVSATVVICDIIDDFASTDAIAAWSWSLSGPATACLKPSDSPTVGAKFTLTVTAETGEDDPMICLTPKGSNDVYGWRLKEGGTNEYVLGSDAPGYTSVCPTHVYVNNVDSKGTIGKLGVGQWGFGVATFLGVDIITIVVRLNGISADPDSCTGVWRSTATVIANVFRSEDVGKYISIFGGVVKISSVISAQQVNCEVMREMDYDSVFFDEDSDGVLEIQSTYDWNLYESMWSAENGYPSCGAFFEDRLVTAGVPDYPETICGSVVGDYENYSLGEKDDDAYSFTLAGRTVSRICWLDPREFLVAGSIGSEWRIGAEDSTKPLTPTNVVAKQQTNYGCADIDPLPIGHSTLFVQAALRKIREFTLDQTSINNDYVAPDLTILAEHITGGKIAGMCYQQEPMSIIWVWMEDGSLASMTYQRDKSANIVGWARHPIDGQVESMVSIPGDKYDEVYAIIKRTINGNTVRNIEVLESVFNDDDDTFQANYGVNAFFVDSGITQSQWNTTSTNIMTLSGASYIAGATLTLTASGAGHTPFSAGDIGKKYRIRIDDDVIDVTITAFTSSTVVSCTSVSAIPTSLQAAGTEDFALLATIITGLDHLEGAEVAIVADGTVRTSQIVSGGQVTIAEPASVIHAGLAYTGNITTVRPELSLRDGTSQGRTKRIISLVIRVDNSATFKAGRDNINYDEYGFNTYDQVLYQEIFQTSDMPLGRPAALFTGDKVCPFDGDFNTDARLTIIQDKPLPLTVVSIMSEIEVSG